MHNDNKKEDENASKRLGVSATYFNNSSKK